MGSGFSGAGWPSVKDLQIINNISGVVGFFVTLKFMIRLDLKQSSHIFYQ